MLKAAFKLDALRQRLTLQRDAPVRETFASGLVSFLEKTYAFPCNRATSPNQFRDTPWQRALPCRVQRVLLAY